jgi:hypothetical protein
MHNNSTKALQPIAKHGKKTLLAVSIPLTMQIHQATTRAFLAKKERGKLLVFSIVLCEQKDSSINGLLVDFLILIKHAINCSCNFQNATS